MTLLKNLQWDAAAWLAQYKAPNADYRNLNKDVYQNTLAVVWAGYYYLQDGTKVVLPSAEHLAVETHLYKRDFKPNPVEEYAGEISVVEGDCLAVAKEFVADGLGKVAVLNMASRSNPGGGVYRGAGAQEEYLFRCSNYFQSLYQYIDYADEYQVKLHPTDRYPLDRNYGGVYSPNVTIFRGTQEEGYPLLAKPWQVNFIAVAGVNHPETQQLADGTKRIVGYDLALTKNKLRTILNIAMDNGVSVLVLGAIGCGAFKNPPEHIALLFKELLQSEPYRGAFKKVIFAIKQDHNSARSKCGGTLYEVFKRIIENGSLNGDKALQELRKQENAALIMHMAAIKKIIKAKCGRCDNVYGCQGCIFSVGEMRGCLDRYMEIVKGM